MSHPMHSPRVFTRRSALIGGLGVGAAVATGVPRTAQAGAGGRHRKRARSAYDALQRHFHDPATGFYLETYPKTGDNPWSYVWPFSQAMIATQTMAGIQGSGKRYDDAVKDRYTALEAYWNSGTEPKGYDSYLRPPAGQGGDKFYDDNEWIALGLLMRHYMAGRRGDQAAVQRAKEIFDLVVSGWDTDPSHPCPGGVFWTQAPWSQDRNTVSNAPGAEVGLRLYLITGDDYYLDWSLKMYTWCRDYMLAPNKLYWDHVDLAGNLNTVQWTYNQGVMIGAGALLYRATGDRTYLDHAEETAAAALDFYAAEDRYFTQPVFFHSIFFSNLLQLSTISPDPAYRQAMEAYADEAYERFADRKTGLYHFNGEEPIELLQQSGITRIEAMLSWRPEDYRKLT